MSLDINAAAWAVRRVDAQYAMLDECLLDVEYRMDQITQKRHKQLAKISRDRAALQAVRARIKNKAQQVREMWADVVAPASDRNNFSLRQCLERFNGSTSEGTFKYMMYYECENVNDVADDDMTLLHVVAATHPSVIITQMAVEEFMGDVSALDRLGRTPLHLAFQHSTLPVIKYLIFLGADPLVQDRDGRTCVDMAAGRPREITEYAQLAKLFCETTSARQITQRRRNAGQFRKICGAFESVEALARLEFADPMTIEDSHPPEVIKAIEWLWERTDSQFTFLIESARAFAHRALGYSLSAGCQLDGLSEISYARELCQQFHEARNEVKRRWKNSVLSELPRDKSIRTLVTANTSGMAVEVFRHFVYFECADISETLADGSGLVHVAINRYRNMKIVRVCIEECFGNVNAKDLNGRGALHGACQTGLLPIIRYLCVCGGDPLAADNHGKTPLNFSAVRANEESLTYIRNITQMFNETSPPEQMHTVETPQQPPAGAVLLAGNRSPKIRRDTLEGYKQMSVMAMAESTVALGEPETEELRSIWNLLDENYEKIQESMRDILFRMKQIRSVDQRTAEALLSEAEYVRKEINRLAQQCPLVKQKWRETVATNDQDAVGTVKKTLQQFCLEHTDCSPEMFKLFVYYGDSCKLAITDNKDVMSDGSSLMHVVASRFGHVSIATIALEEGFGQLNEKDSNGRTCLHLACATAPLNTIKYLVFHGADPLEKDNFKKLPLDFARTRAVEEILTWMEIITEVWSSTSTSPETKVRREREKIRSHVDIEMKNAVNGVRMLKEMRELQQNATQPLPVDDSTQELTMCWARLDAHYNRLHAALQDFVHRMNQIRPFDEIAAQLISEMTEARDEAQRLSSVLADVKMRWADTLRAPVGTLKTQSLLDFFTHENVDALPEVFKYFLYNSCIDITEVLPDRNTILHLAVSCMPNNLRVIAVVIEDGLGSPEAVDARGQSPLHIACRCGQLPLIKYLIHHGSRVTQRDKDSKQPLDIARERRISSDDPQVDELTRYLETLTEVMEDTKALGGTQPRRRGQPQTLSRVLSSELGEMITHSPQRMMIEELKKIALSSFVEPISEAETPRVSAIWERLDTLFSGMHLALQDFVYRVHQVKAFNEDTSQLLNESSMAREEARRLALSLMNVKCRWQEALKDEHSSERTQGLRDFLAIAASLESEGVPQKFRYWLYYLWANNNEVLDDGSTLLHIVCSRFSQLKFVIIAMEEAFGDPNSRDYNGRTPLHVACVSAPLTIIKYLIHHGADATVRDAMNKLPLDFARARGIPEIIRYVETVTDVMQNTMISPELQLAKQSSREATPRAGTTPTGASSQEGAKLAALHKLSDFRTHIATARTIAAELPPPGSEDVANCWAELDRHYDLMLTGLLDYCYRVYQIKAFDQAIARLLDEAAGLRGEAMRLIQVLSEVKLRWASSLSEEAAAQKTHPLKEVLSRKAEVPVHEFRTFLLHLCSDITEKASDGSSLLHQVLVNSNEKLPMVVVEEFFGDVNCTNLNGRTPLHVACASSTLAVIQYLVQHGADPLAVDNFGKKPLDFARTRNDEDICVYMETISSVMVQTHALPDMRQQDPGRGSVRFGCRRDSESNARTTAFLESIKRAKHVQPPAEEEDDIGDPGSEAIAEMWDKINRHYHKLMNGLGASMFRLKQIRSFDQSQISARLLAELTDISQQQRRLKATLPQTKLRWQAALESDNERNQRLRDFFALFGSDTELEVYKVFMYHRCINIFELMPHEKTALHCAVEILGDLRIIRCTVEEFFGDVNARDDQGRTPLHYAALKSNLNIVKYLIAFGADLTATDNHGRLPTDLAVTNPHTEVLAYMSAVAAIGQNDSQFVM